MKEGYNRCWKEVAIHPTVSPLHEAAITIPTVNGTLSYSFKDDGTTYHATVTIPEGMTVHFIAPDGYLSANSHDSLLRAGTHKLDFIRH